MNNDSECYEMIPNDVCPKFKHLLYYIYISRSRSKSRSIYLKMYTHICIYFIRTFKKCFTRSISRRRWRRRRREEKERTKRKKKKHSKNKQNTRYDKLEEENP